MVRSAGTGCLGFGTGGAQGVLARSVCCTMALVPIFPGAAELKAKGAAGTWVRVEIGCSCLQPVPETLECFGANEPSFSS